ncbi:hypothetical protein HSX37_12690|uniref:Uncharacterized protein n=1 Tax=Dendrosporobacter quercicolus TaxID=146817 RepID=A0A1G9TPS3_9FIRM|nr:hypothetical protein [Dendrosporobacter quercicolus]NSL48892.1 hypothetical protein [Dendrosporobacter quercicolus DSM 1736]SDM49779.1 hypothetical protein SAMN04488502_10547 [Dendrosporobacter quercicolus]
MNDNIKVYRFWNGKNIDGKSVAGDQNLLEETAQENKDTLMKYEVGVDTFSADDLQRGTDNG